jgi:hypothetical protein
MRGSTETNQVHPSDLKFPIYEGIKRDQSSSPLRLKVSPDMRGSKETNKVHSSDLKFPRYEGIKKDQSSSPLKLKVSHI